MRWRGLFVKLKSSHFDDTIIKRTINWILRRCDRRMKNRDFFIKAFAYFHRYGWIVVMLLCVTITKSLYTAGSIVIVFSIWTLLGYLLKWKHIFCSFQNAYHMSMTPNKINWSNIRKSDAYGIPAIFFILGLGLVFAQFF